MVTTRKANYVFILFPYVSERKSQKVRKNEEHPKKEIPLFSPRN